MAAVITKLWFLLLLVLAILDLDLDLAAAAAAKGSVFTTQTLSRADFPPPPHFLFGAATSAYQYEGAAFEDGKTPSIWDTFSHSAGGARTTRGDIAGDGYHKYKEDIQLMVDTGLEAYRFSISWPRLVPNGRGPVNPKALAYYNNLINELMRNGIEPHVTLMHYDSPQSLEDEYGGWISRKMVDDFTAYANVCFREFGDRIRHWTTVNEANVFVVGGYDTGTFPPQRCSFPYGNCSVGNSSTEPYIVAHHILLAHASAARLYKTKYQISQHGFIGMNLYAFLNVPYTNTTEDVIATKRSIDFFLGWFLDPLIFGDYPDIMKRNASPRIPAFTKTESDLIKGSADFIGLNFYYKAYVKDKSSNLKIDDRDYKGDMAAEYLFDEVDTLPDDPTLLSEFAVEPSGLLQLLEYFKRFYGNPTIYIHENGQETWRKAALYDTPRVKYLEGYLGALLDAIRNGSNVKGYFYWSFMDLVELVDEETSYGLYYVDLDCKDLIRYPKLSALWYSNFLKGNNTSLRIAVGGEKKILLPMTKGKKFLMQTLSFR